MKNLGLLQNVHKVGEINPPARHLYGLHSPELARHTYQNIVRQKGEEVCCEGSAYPAVSGSGTEVALGLQPAGPKKLTFFSDSRSVTSWL